MTTIGNRARTVLSWHRPLMIQVALMSGLVLVALGGVLIDDRVQNGVSVWEKPLKFAVAFVAYGLTLGWMLSLPHKGRRFTWWVGTVVALSGTADVAVIAMQGARGTFSHFNTADAYGELTQNVFSIGVPILMLANMILAITLIVQRVGDKGTAMAVRLAAFYSIAGMFLGLLISMNPDGQSGDYTDGNGDPVTLAISHSVGTRDDAPVMPFTGWNATAGDLRIPHFVGMHGMQVMLLVGLLVAGLAARVAWLRDERTRRAVIGVAGLCYGGLTALVTWQALRGQSLIHPDAKTWTALGAIAVVTAALFAVTVAVGKSRARAEARMDARVPELV
ncbi:hypothetical protein Afil01_49840 [Actinorhabdospora filicis]|uniref:Uncharacterized protein n=1 Tax=Actinorhabdospora filicis TaxID=1785913 RepID=A0A9W6SQT8_9ACTN|nr:hypothetical protein [Actinorhabdospora filicis]GLZ80177.1 hypothetical protein Afil01_49840 [Actinorhabdospora filicis]